jgi:hypothetical protein
MRIWSRALAAGITVPSMCVRLLFVRSIVLLKFLVQYASDSRTSLRDLQPSVEDRKQPWAVAYGPTGPWQWGRYEACDDSFGECLQSLQPPSHPRSIVITRPVKDPAYGMSAERQQVFREVFFYIKLRLTTLL